MTTAARCTDLSNVADPEICGPERAVFLRWQGSKRSQAALLASLVPPESGRYHEPFLGSGAVFFAARPRQATLSDHLEPLIETFVAIRDEPKDVARAMGRLIESKDYYAIRSLAVDTNDTATAAARFLYLNSHCFNGLYRTNRAGFFNVPEGARVPAPPTLANLLTAARTLANVEIHARDATVSLALVQPGDFVYVDPPYPAARPTYGEYGYHTFDMESWRTLVCDQLRELNKCGAVFVLSMPTSLVDEPDIECAIHYYSAKRLDVSYRAGGNRSGQRPASQLIVTNSRMAEPI